MDTWPPTRQPSEHWFFKDNNGVRSNITECRVGSKISSEHVLGTTKSALPFYSITVTRLSVILRAIEIKEAILTSYRYSFIYSQPVIQTLLLLKNSWNSMLMYYILYKFALFTSSSWYNIVNFNSPQQQASNVAFWRFCNKLSKLLEASSGDTLQNFFLQK